MNKLNLFTFSLLLFISISFGQQKNTIYGKVKTIREKVEFLTEKENPQFLYNDDYGHSGFMGAELTISRFKSIWYSTNFCYYLNYKRHYNENGLLIEDIWYDKKDSLENYYRYEYDKQDRLIRKIDSLYDLVYIDTHYYERDRHETIISQNSDLDFYNYRYKRYDENGKLIRQKRIDEYGTINEYIFKYNDSGELLYRIYKNPNSYRKVGERSWSWGVQDTIGNIYKDLVNKYDESNRLIERKTYGLKSDGDHKGTKLGKHTIFKYKNNNLIQEITGSSSDRPYYTNYEYDKVNRLKKKYYYTEKESNTRQVEKYDYKNDKIKFLEYTEEDWSSKELKTYKVEFDYKYDANGNWNEIVKKVDGKELYKWIRQIEYYK
ncbi:hypothetical protein [Winogradskyella costae]|uniref:hypothetical protein n=1 Tax=Winogradskyella costae TaxID=2697008 RepID=UPI0015CBF542|nr:hypothetical protein [Winogradskyella costae]